MQIDSLNLEQNKHTYQSEEKEKEHNLVHFNFTATGHAKAKVIFYFVGEF